LLFNDATVRKNNSWKIHDGMVPIRLLLSKNNNSNEFKRHRNQYGAIQWMYDKSILDKIEMLASCNCFVIIVVVIHICFFKGQIGQNWNLAWFLMFFVFIVGFLKIFFKFIYYHSHLICIGIKSFYIEKYKKTYLPIGCSQA